MTYNRLLSHKTADLVTIIAIAVTAILMSLADVDVQFFRLLFGLPLAFFLPGYAIAAALFPEKTLSRIERVLFSIGLSLAVSTLSAITIYPTGWKVASVTVTLSVGGITLFASIAALIQRRRGFVLAASDTTQVLEDVEGIGDNYSARATHAIYRRPLEFDIRHLILLMLSGMVVVGALIVTSNGATQQVGSFTQFWALPAEQASDHGTIQLGIRNQEQKEVTYMLRVEAAEEELHTWDVITLKPGEQWEDQFVLPQDSITATVEAVLYRSSEPDVVYRRVTVQTGTGKG